MSTTRKLTPADVRKYIDSQGAICPYCQRDTQIAHMSCDTGNGEIVESMHCRECGAQWAEVYGLKGVWTEATETDEPEYIEPPADLLTAAASDLLSACRSLAAAWDTGEDRCQSVEWEDVEMAVAAAREAIAKAEGR